MRTFRFYKDTDGWFVDLPEWTGEKWELEMVSGADTLNLKFMSHYRQHHLKMQTFFIFKS